MKDLECVIYISLLVIFIILLLKVSCEERYNKNNYDGFRTKMQKKEIAGTLITHGKPDRSTFRSLLLDGTEYYDAKQLWIKNNYTTENLQNIL